MLHTIERILHMPIPWTVWSATDHLMHHCGNKIPDQVMLVRPQVIAYEGKPVSWIALADVIGYHFKEKHYTMY
jgi:hypothetical protein